MHIDATTENVAKVYEALIKGFDIYQAIRQNQCKGFITYKEDTRADGEKLETYQVSI